VTVQRAQKASDDQRPGLADVVGMSLEDAYQEVFRAVGDPTRLRILLLVAQEAEYPCTRLESTLQISKSTVSYHVKILRDAGLISVRKDGRFYHYRLRREATDFFLPGFLERCRDQHGETIDWAPPATEG